MSTLIRTDEVPAVDRLDFVQEMTATLWVPMELRSDHRADYRGEFRANGLGAMQVVVLDMMPVTVHRTPKLICQADPDMLKMALVCGGSVVISQGGRQARLSPGEFAFYDTRRPYEVAFGVDGEQPSQVITFMFPPSLLPLSPSRRQTAHRRALPGHRRAGRSDLAVPAPAGPQHRSLQPGRGRAAVHRRARGAGDAAGARAGRQRWATPEARRHALLATVQGFIQQHLGDSGLSPAAIAAAHHISLRSLHQLFHDEGLTVAGWIRRGGWSAAAATCPTRRWPPARWRPSRPAGASPARATSAGPSAPHMGCRPRSTAGSHAM